MPYYMLLVGTKVGRKVKFTHATNYGEDRSAALAAAKAITDAYVEVTEHENADDEQGTEIWHTGCGL